MFLTYRFRVLFFVANLYLNYMFCKNKIVNIYGKKEPQSTKVPRLPLVTREGVSTG